LEAPGFHTGIGFDLLVALGLTKRPPAFYYWLHYRFNDLADYQMG